MMERPVPKSVKTMANRKHHQNRSFVAPSFSRKSRANENIITTTEIQKARLSSPATSGLSTASCTRGIRFPATMTRLVIASAFATLFPGAGVGVGDCADTVGAIRKMMKIIHKEHEEARRGEKC